MFQFPGSGLVSGFSGDVWRGSNSGCTVGQRESPVRGFLFCTHEPRRLYSLTRIWIGVTAVRGIFRERLLEKHVLERFYWCDRGPIVLPCAPRAWTTEEFGQNLRLCRAAVQTSWAPIKSTCSGQALPILCALPTRNSMATLMLKFRIVSGRLARCSSPLNNCLQHLVIWN